jgi:hypothetical protein
MMRLPFHTSGDREYLEPAPSPVLPQSCLLALVVVDVRLGSRLALIAAAVAAVSLATRLPRVLPVTAVLCLVIAGIAVLGGPGNVAVIAAHAVIHAPRASSGGAPSSEPRRRGSRLPGAAVSPRAARAAVV